MLQKIRIHSIFSTEKDSHYQCYLDFFVFSTVIKPGTVKSRPHILTPNTTQTSKKFIQAAKFLICIREMPDSNLNQNMRDISCYPQFLRANAGIPS